MSQEITVEYCSKLLVPPPGSIKVTSKELIEQGFLTSLKSLSLQERFELAFQLLPELGIYFDTRVYGKSPKVISDLFDRLVEPLRKFSGISVKEYNYLIDNLSTYLLVMVLDNKYLPIDLFLDSKRSWNRVNSVMFLEGTNCIKSTYDRRKPEIITYAKQLVPDSGHMNDDMVLSVAGVKL